MNFHLCSASLEERRRLLSKRVKVVSHDWIEDSLSSDSCRHPAEDKYDLRFVLIWIDGIRVPSISHSIVLTREPVHRYSLMHGTAYLILPSRDPLCPSETCNFELADLLLTFHEAQRKWSDSTVSS